MGVVAITSISALNDTFTKQYRNVMGIGINW